MDLRLVEIGKDGTPAVTMELSETAQEVCKAMAATYEAQGFVRPWVGYLAESDELVVGTCAFKAPPDNKRVEIAYFTFPEYEGRGIATEMAKKLVEIAKETSDDIIVAAQTLPSENASTSVLRKLGFQYIGTVMHPEDGEVWEWRLP